MNGIYFFITAFVSIFSVLNPFGALPTLIALTSGFSDYGRKIIVRRSVLVAAGMIIGFMLVGTYIFEILGINISDFQIAGGILLFKVALDMLSGRMPTTKLTKEERDESFERESIGIVPLGTPLLAGPGTITTAMIYFNQKGAGLQDSLLVLAAVIIAILASYVILHLSSRLFDRLGKTGSLLISRIMGLLLASIAVSFIVNGIIDIYRSTIL